MNIDYARVSTGDQNLNMQMDALNKIECDKIFADKMSDARSDRPGLDEAMNSSKLRIINILRMYEHKYSLFYFHLYDVSLAYSVIRLYIRLL